MARTTTGPSRLKEFVGIPLDRDTKQRLKRVATERKRSFTEVAREYVVDGLERDEKSLAAAK